MFKPKSKSKTITFDDGFQYTYDDEDGDIIMGESSESASPKSSTIVVGGAQATILQEEIRLLLDLWDREPFYFRYVPKKFYDEFQICRNDPPGTIEFEDFDIVNYKTWLETLVESNSGNYNCYEHLVCVAAAIGLNDVIVTFILMNKDVLYAVSDSQGRDPMALAQLHGHAEIVHNLRLTEKFRQPAEIQFIRTNSSISPQMLNAKIGTLLNFLQKYPRLCEKLDLVTAFKVKNLVRDRQYNHDEDSRSQNYCAVMRSLVNRADGMALRYAIHQGEPTFLSDLLSFNTDAIRNFTPGQNQTNLFEYGTQVWDQDTSRDGNSFTKRARIMQILIEHGACKDKTTHLSQHGDNTIVEVQSNTTEMLMELSLTRARGTNAQSSASSTTQSSQKLSHGY